MCTWLVTHPLFVIVCRINSLAFIRYMSEASNQISDPNEVIAFLEKAETKIKGNQEALLLCRVLVGHVQLKKGDQAKTKVCIFHGTSVNFVLSRLISCFQEVVNKLEKEVDEYDGVSAAHGPFYQLSSDLYRLQVCLSEIHACIGNNFRGNL